MRFVLRCAAGDGRGLRTASAGSAWYIDHIKAVPEFEAMTLTKKALCSGKSTGASGSSVERESP
jgi:hypothetical protein